MHKLTLITVATASILAGCSDMRLPATAQTTPKHAAQLCNGWYENVAPTEKQAQVVANYRAGQISFNECLLRLRS
jgi:hypothetical protein